METEEFVEKIIDDGDIENMHKLTDILSDAMEIVKDCDEEKYEKTIMKLYTMAYGKVLNKEMAEKIVHKMQPYGMRWTLEEVKDIQDRYGIDDIRSEDLFIVMNSAFNDYKDLFNENTDNYIKYALDFIKDEDAKEGKVFIYYTTIPK